VDIFLQRTRLQQNYWAFIVIKNSRSQSLLDKFYQNNDKPDPFPDQRLKDHKQNNLNHHSYKKPLTDNSQKA